MTVNEIISEPRQPKPAGLRPLSLGSVLEALADAGEKALDVETMDGMVGRGYHITEVKAGTFVALDCGGNPDRWEETILQIEDLAQGDMPQMTAGKFSRIVNKVLSSAKPDLAARLTVEIGPPNTAMRIFDAVDVLNETNRTVLRLAPRPAICKPRHREELGLSLAAQSACCGGPSGGKACCG